jgi:hypothetical protein
MALLSSAAVDEGGEGRVCARGGPGGRGAICAEGLEASGVKRGREQRRGSCTRPNKLCADDQCEFGSRGSGMTIALGGRLERG